MKSTRTYGIRRLSREGAETDVDMAAVEEPLEIRLVYSEEMEIRRRTVAVTMRTPGDDVDLALGFLHGEGILKSIDDVSGVRPCDNPDLDARHRGNNINVHLKTNVSVDLSRLERNFYTSSSCGVCGKASIEAVGMVGCPVLHDRRVIIGSDVLQRLPASLQSRQPVFQRTGGIHAAAIFDGDGHLLEMREDVGRHNALDKVVGSALQQGRLPFHEAVLLVSGRTSFELVQKALMAGIPVMAAIGAPSSLAIELAREYEMTLIGFLRGDRFNVYSAPDRIAGRYPLPTVGTSQAAAGNHGR